MNVSFTLGAGQDINTSQMASRVLTENILRNDKFNAKFLNFCINYNYQFNKNLPKYADQISNKNKTLGTSAASWFNMLKLSLGHYRYVDLLLEELKTDYLFYSCSLTVLEFKTVALLLNNGVKLVIGGSLLDCFSFKEIRDIISELVDKKYMKNLLIVKGYVDLNTNLYRIVKNWKDCVIEDNDFSTLWECEHDYISDKINALQRFSNHFDLSFLNDSYPFKYSVFMLDNHCWWNKCKFCFYPFSKKIDYTGGASVEKISNNIINNVKNDGSEGVFFANDYFMFNDKYEKIMKNLVKNDVKICIFTGIKALQNREYIEKVNKYVSAFKLGVESFSDFSLQYITKGYTYEDIKDAVCLMKNNMKRDVIFLTSIIADLPAESQEDIIQNYERASHFKNEMIEAGFEFKYSAKILVINRQTKEQFIDNKYMRMTQKGQKISGRYLLFKYFRELDIITDDLYKEMAVPFTRYDKDGNELDTDFNIVPESLAKEVTTWK